MHENIIDIYTYMRAWSEQLGQRILQEYPALHRFEDPVAPRIVALLRRPLSRTIYRHHGNCQALARSLDRESRGRMRYWQDSDLAGSRPRAQRWPPVPRRPSTGNRLRGGPFPRQETGTLSSI
jgi:hypothetical protein